MTHSIPLELTRELPATREAHACLSHSRLFSLIRSKNSVMLSLVQLAQTMFQLHQPLAEETQIRAETAYAQGMQYVEQLPENERTSVSFELG